MITWHGAWATGRQPEVPNRDLHPGDSWTTITDGNVFGISGSRVSAHTTFNQRDAAAFRVILVTCVNSTLLNVIEHDHQHTILALPRAFRVPILVDVLSGLYHTSCCNHARREAGERLIARCSMEYTYIQSYTTIGEFADRSHRSGRSKKVPRG
jgi:hypothetical protein